MKALVVKTSSMGDVIHTLPALSDAMDAVPGIRFDWIVEENFAEVPSWHPAVDRVIRIAQRRWRKAPVKAWSSGEWRAYADAVRQTRYDAVIDAQGLLKSAVLATRLARGTKYGLDRNSAKEPLSAFFLDRPVAVAKGQHAVERTRQLFAAALGYALPQTRGDYRIAGHFRPDGAPRRDLVFLHATTRHEKHWPEDYWRELVATAGEAGWRVRLPWANETERQRAERLAAVSASAEVLPRLSLGGIAKVLADAAGVVSVDTGLSHLAAALGRPNVVLFGPTEPGLVGGYGERQLCLKASDFPPVERRTDPEVFAPLTPALVWSHLQSVLEREAG